MERARRGQLALGFLTSATRRGAAENDRLKRGVRPARKCTLAAVPLTGWAVGGKRTRNFHWTGGHESSCSLWIYRVDRPSLSELHPQTFKPFAQGGSRDPEVKAACARLRLHSASMGSIKGLWGSALSSCEGRGCVQGRGRCWGAGGPRRAAGPKHVTDPKEQRQNRPHTEQPQQFAKASKQGEKNKPLSL